MSITSQWWNKREESRKSWDSVCCDELVYLPEFGDADRKLSHVFAEKYLRHDLWFHIRWLEADASKTGDAYHEAIIDGVVRHAHQAMGNRYPPVSAIDRNGAVLVDVPELVELPEGVSVYSVRSIVRLKRVENAVDAGMEQCALLPVGLVGIADWEGNLPCSSVGRRDGIGKEVNQVPGQLVESGAKAVDKIPHAESNVFGYGVRAEDEKVLRSIRIILFLDRVGLTFHPISNLHLRRLEVKVCPSGFHVDVLQ